MSVLTHRLQILLDDERYHRLTAADHILNTPPMPVPDPTELLTEIDAIRSRYV